MGVARERVGGSDGGMVAEMRSVFRMLDDISENQGTRR